MKHYKSICSIAFLMFGFTSFAHDLIKINHASSPALQSVVSVMESMNKDNPAKESRNGEGTVLKIDRIESVSPPQKKGESNEAVLMRVLKAQMHSDYPITGDDGGYDLSFAKSVADVAKLATDDLSDDTLIAALKTAVEKGLVVMIGTGGGNNTIAYIAAVADSDTKELVYYMSSNFGSDD